MHALGVRAALTGTIWALLMLGALLLWPAPARAQDTAFVQIESHATLEAAQRRARGYARLFPDVTAFRARTGLYAIALGPYGRRVAQERLRDLLGRGAVPFDSFVTDASPYVAQVYPVGDTVLDTTTAPAKTAPLPTAPAPAPAPASAGRPKDQDSLPNAIDSEARLTRAERLAIQTALQGFGLYRGAIDGDFGPATRDAIWGWQRAEGLVPTGVLTPAQREQLLTGYQAAWDGIGMTLQRDTRAGIEIELPMGMVALDGYAFPFALYGPVDDSAVQVLLISQPGDSTTLRWLYEMMAELAIVPPSGTRSRGQDRFVLTGQSEGLRSHTEVRLIDGALKGFSLVWPPDQDAPAAQILPRMQASFRAIDGVLDPDAAPPDPAPGPDLAIDLTTTAPARLRTGFFVDAAGHVMTTAAAIGDDCARLAINTDMPAEIAHVDPALGLAFLRPARPVRPPAHAALAPLPGRVGTQIAVAGFPFDGAVGTATLGFGTLDILQAPDAAPMIQRLGIATDDSEAGAPVLDQTGAVLGMVVPGATADGGPDAGPNPGAKATATLAVRADALAGALAAAGIRPTLASQSEPLGPEALARLGAAITVTVSCWN
ncbi:MAG: hypothetical protein RLZZ491_452 [Pseudomonadota bacterium]